MTIRTGAGGLRRLWGQELEMSMLRQTMGAAGIWAGLVVLLGGCAGDGGVASRAEPAEAASSLAGDGQAAVDIGSLLVRQPSRACFADVRGSSAGAGGAGRKLVKVSEAAAGSAGGTWFSRQCVWEDGKLELGTLSEQEFRLGEDGSLELVRSIEHDDEVVTWFEPPARVLRAGMRAGDVFTQELRMVVRPMGEPGKVKTQGDAQARTEVLGPAEIQTPEGVVGVQRFRRTLKAKLGAANVEVITEFALAAGRGLVSEKTRERVTVLGLAIRSGSESWAREGGACGPAEELAEELAARPAER